MIVRLIVRTEMPGSGYEGGVPVQRGRTFDASEPVRNVIEFIADAVGCPQRGTAGCVIDERQEPAAATEEGSP